MFTGGFGSDQVSWSALVKMYIILQEGECHYCDYTMDASSDAQTGEAPAGIKKINQVNRETLRFLRSN